jgi:hypothetical protein
MSLKTSKNVAILGAVVAGLVVGTVLLGNYVNILPAKADDKAQVKYCPARAGSPACGMTCPEKQGAPCCAAESCPPDCDKPCCAEDDQVVCPLGAPKACCPAADVKACPRDCDRPCCVKQTDDTKSVQGCCSAAAACPLVN